MNLTESAKHRWHIAAIRMALGAVLLTSVACVQPGPRGKPSDAPVPSPLPPSPTGFLWGVNGHFGRPYAGPNYAYNRVSQDDQIRLLKAAGLNSYRGACATLDCGTWPDALKRAGDTFLWTLDMKPDEKLSEAQNHDRAYKFAMQAAQTYRNDVAYFEAANELDNWVGIKGDGSARGQYDQAKYSLARGTIRGLIDGVHAGNPAAAVMVDDAGWCHYGFLKTLWEDGIRWDITAFHWYENQGNIEKAGCGNGANIAAIHASFGKPVWITEFNSDKAAKAGDDNEAANWLAQFVKQVKAVGPRYNIQGAFVYELLDEPNLQGMESHFGIATGDGSGKLPLQTFKSMLQ